MASKMLPFAIMPILFLVFALSAFSQNGNACWAIPCPYQQGVGAVCKLNLFIDGGCYCYEEGSPPHQSCATGPFDCLVGNPNGNGCNAGLNPKQVQAIRDRLSVTKGPIHVHMSEKCWHGELGKVFRREAAKRNIAITWSDKEDRAHPVVNKLQ